MRFLWSYFHLTKDGKLIDKEFGDELKTEKRFSSIEEAEQYLEENDIRGTVVSSDLKGGAKNEK